MSTNNNVIQMKRFVQVERELDKETGELIPIRTVERDLESRDHFFKTYVDDIAPLIGCTNAEKNLLICLAGLTYVEYNSNEVVLNPFRRKQLAECAKIEIRSLNNSISRLLKKKILIKESGRMLLNPQYFFVGEEVERAKMLRFLFQYNFGQKKATNKEINSITER